MELPFKVTVSDEQIDIIKDNTGLETLEDIAEWFAECYYWGAIDHLSMFGATPKIDPSL